MPISDSDLQGYIEHLLVLSADLSKQNCLLLELLLKRDGAFDDTTKVEIPQGVRSVGKQPWNLMKNTLEQKTKPKLSIVTGIPDKKEEIDEEEKQVK